MEGPCSLFFDPVEYKAVSAKRAVFVNAGEAIVIYRALDGDKKGDVERRVLHGPTQYVPHPKEWTHEFWWHGVDPSDKTRFVQGGNPIDSG